MAGLSVNSWGQTEDVEALIRGGAHPPPALLADTEVPLAELRLLLAGPVFPERW